MWSIRPLRGLAWLVAVVVVLFSCGAWAQDETSDAPDTQVTATAEAEDELFAADDEPNEEDVGEDEPTEEGPEAEDPHTGLETLTVTAQKRSQKLQEVPAAVTAISGGQLDDAGFTQMQDIASLVPNMHFGQEQGSAKITIRGVSNAQGTDQSTAVHIDGIYQNRSRALTALTFFDIKRIEVLRGPQGTLYGRNATGGAMNIISEPPSQDFELFGDVQFGNYWQQLIRGVINVPLADDLAALRVSGYYENRDGYQKNFCDGRDGSDGNPPDDNSDPNTPNCNRPAGSDNDADDAKDFGIRTQVKLTPGDSVDATFRFNYLRKRGVGYGLKREGDLPPFVLLPLPDPIPPQQPIYQGATENPDNLRHVFEDTVGEIDIETINGNADLGWSIPSMSFFGQTNLKAIGSFTQYDDAETSDQDYTDLFIASLDQSSLTREWVVELNWSSDSDGDWGWLMGLFHLGTRSDRIVDAPSLIRIFNPPNPPAPVPFPFYQTFEENAYSVAGFANGWFDLTERLRLELGFRYSHDWKQSHLQADETRIIGFPVFAEIDDPRAANWGRPSGSISLDYQMTEESLLYGRFATGYKSGALNNDIAILGGSLTSSSDPGFVPPDPGCEVDQDPDADPDDDCDGLVKPPNADPENIFALEFGLKNSLLDNRLLANLTFFNYWYRDLQVSQLFEAQNIIQNAASARVFGIETELTYRPIDALTLTAQFAYLDSFYRDYQQCIDAKDLSVQDCTGNVLTRAPRFSGTFIAMYEFDFGGFGTLTPFGQLYASDEVFFRPTNEPADTQDAYFLLNFRLMWQSQGGRLGLDLFVDNALDEDVATTKIVGSTLLGAPLLNAYDRPRTVGARVSLAW